PRRSRRRGARRRPSPSDCSGYRPSYRVRSGPAGRAMAIPFGGYRRCRSAHAGRRPAECRAACSAIAARSVATPLQRDRSEPLETFSERSGITDSERREAPTGGVESLPPHTLGSAYAKSKSAWFWFSFLIFVLRIVSESPSPKSITTDLPTLVIIDLSSA